MASASANVASSVLSKTSRQSVSDASDAIEGAGGPDGCGAGDGGEAGPGGPSNAFILKADRNRRWGNWRAWSARRCFRSVEQDLKEPNSLIVFKWALMAVGILMMGAVVFIMGDLMWRWVSGGLPTHRHG